MSQTLFGKAVSLTGMSAEAWFTAITRRNGGSQQVRNDLRDVHFRAHARIRSVTVGEFCDQFRSREDSPVEALQVPDACLRANLGSPAYYLALASISRALRPKQIVEFGTYLGYGTVTLAMNAPHAQILTVDLPDDVEDIGHLNQTDQIHVRDSRNRVGQLYAGTPYEPRIANVKCDSRRLRLHNYLQSADLVLVDGGHDLGCITADTENALSVGHPGTVILWDDYLWLYPDVVHYLDRLAQRLRLVWIADTNIVAYIC